MYKLFSFFFFTSVTAFFVTTFSKLDLPTGPYVIINVFVYFGFIFYVILSTFFKSKYSLSETRLIKLVKQKLGKTNYALDFIGSFVALIYFSVVLVTIMFIFGLFAFPMFRDDFVEKVIDSKQPVSTSSSSDYNILIREIHALDDKVKNLQYASFLQNNKAKYTSSDDRYNFGYEISSATTSGSHFLVEYNLEFCKKNVLPYYCLSASPDTMYIQRSITRFSTRSEDLSLIEDPIFIMSLEDEDMIHYRVFYIQNAWDSSAMYISFEPRTDLGASMEEIVSITTDGQNSSLTVKYLNDYDKPETVVVQFSVNEQGDVIYTLKHSETDRSVG